MRTLILFILLSLPSQILLAEDYGEIYHQLSQANVKMAAIDALDAVEDKADFILSLTVGQIMQLPSVSQRIVMRSVPFYIVDFMFERDGIDIFEDLVSIDFKQPKILTICESFLLGLMADLVEDIQIASESEWDPQVMSFRGPLIRGKYRFYRGNLVKEALDKMTDLFVQLELSQMPITSDFLEGIKKTMQALSQDSIVSMFQKSHSINVYPSFIHAYISYIQSINVLALIGNLPDEQSTFDFIRYAKNAFMAPTLQMINFLDEFSLNRKIEMISFDDPREFSYLNEQDEWDFLFKSISDYHDFMESMSTKDYDVTDNATDAHRMNLDTEFKGAAMEMSIELGNLREALHSKWDNRHLSHWQRNLKHYFEKPRYISADSHQSETADVLFKLSKLSHDDFKKPIKIKFDTIDAAKIVIFKDANGSQTIYYPKNLDVAASDYMHDYAVNYGSYLVGMGSFKRLLQLGWGARVTTQGAFVVQDSVPSKIHYSAAYEANGIHWDVESPDRLLLFSMSNWEVFLQPQVNKERSILMIETDEQWEASKEKALRLAHKMGKDVRQVPLSQIVTAMNNIIKEDNPDEGLYSREGLEMTRDTQMLELSDKTDCLSLFKKKNRL